MIEIALPSQPLVSGWYESAQRFPTPSNDYGNDASPVFQGLRDNALYRPGAEYAAPSSQNVILLVLSKIRYGCSNVWETYVTLLNCSVVDSCHQVNKHLEVIFTTFIN